METTKTLLNDVLVKIFNQLLFNEEDYIKQHCPSIISIKGVHILEAVRTAEQTSGASMGNIASILKITAGTLTVGLKKLEKEGLIIKSQCKTDKRIYIISLSDSGKKVLKAHDAYHKKLIDTIAGNLSKKEEADLVDLLSKIKYYIS